MAAMPSLTVFRKISYVAVLIPFLTFSGTLRAEDPVRPSYLDGMVRDYFQKWEDSLQGREANETVFQLTEIDRTFNLTSYKTIKIQFQKEKKSKNPNLKVEVKLHKNAQINIFLVTNRILYEFRNNQIITCDLNPAMEPAIIYSPWQYQNILSDSVHDVLYGIYFSQLYFPKSVLLEYEATRCENDEKTVAFYLRRKKPTRSWADDIRRIVFQKSGGFPIQFETGGTDQFIYDILKMDPRPAFDLSNFDPPTRRELEAASSKYNKMLPASLRHPLHPGPQLCNESR